MKGMVIKMKKLITMIAVLAIMATMAMPAFAADGTAATAPKGGGLGASTGLSTATGGTNGLTWVHTNDDDDISAASSDPNTDIDVWALTTQTDTYKVTIEWGDMTFNYGFGTWNPGTHIWDAVIGWETSDFDGTKDQVKVINHSSQAITAVFSYLADTTTNTGTFTKATGNLNGATTGTMTIGECPVGASDATAPADKTYLNLQGRPASAVPALIGATAKKIGTIIVTIAG